MTIAVDANSVEEFIEWDTSLSGCRGYDLYPFYHGASSAARHSFEVRPSVIVQVPKGQKFSFSDARQIAELQFSSLSVEVEKDQLVFAGLVLHVNRSFGSPFQASDFVCSPTTCTVTPF